MRTWQFFSRISAAVIMLGVCTAQSHSLARSSKDATQPLSMSILPLSESFKVGTTIEFEVTVTNVGDHAILVQTWGPNSPDEFTVRNGDGHEVLPSTRVKIEERDGKYVVVFDPELKMGSTAAAELQPGKTQVYKEALPGTFDLSRPGKYWIYAWRPDGLGDGGLVKSNTVRVTITP